MKLRAPKPKVSVRNTVNSDAVKAIASIKPVKSKGWSASRFKRKQVKAIKDIAKFNQSNVKHIASSARDAVASIAASSTVTELDRNRNNSSSYKGSLSAWMNQMDSNPNPSQGQSGESQTESTTQVGGGWRSAI